MAIEAKDPSSPIDSREWPRELTANAVDASESRLLGYDVEGDLALHYRFSDLLYLALTGELPDDASSRAFEAVLMVAAPLSVAAAPAHAAVLARLCGARVSGVMSVASLTLGEHATALVADLDGALGLGADILAEKHRAAGDADRRAVAALARLLAGILDVPVLAKDPSRDVAIVAALLACGIPAAQVPYVLVVARMPSVLAEATRTKPGDFPNYPIDTPHVRYEAKP